MNIITLKFNAHCLDCGLYFNIKTLPNQTLIDVEKGACPNCKSTLNVEHFVENKVIYDADEVNATNKDYVYDD